MLTTPPTIDYSSPSPTVTQKIHWSRQRLLAIASQLTILVVGMVTLTHTLITLGEHRLQKEWATQRYNELQTISTIMTEKIYVQRYRNKIFANGLQIKQYINEPSLEKQQQLQQTWQDLVKHTPDLLGVTLFDALGKRQLSTQPDFSDATLPPALLDAARHIAAKEVYTSPIAFTSRNGSQEPYIKQIARLTQTATHNTLGYLVTYNSIAQILETIQPAFSHQVSPLLMFDPQGALYAGAHNLAPLTQLPYLLGENLSQSHPLLWQAISSNSFGKFNDQDATFVYLKIELSTQQNAHNEYFLLSYIHNADIAARFEHWQHVVIATALILTLLSALLILFWHINRLQQQSRQYNIDMTNRLFHSDIGLMLVNQYDRIVSVNHKAANGIGLSPAELAERNLQHTLCLEDADYNDIKVHTEKMGQWSGTIKLDGLSGATLRVRISQAPKLDADVTHLLVALEDISELVDSKKQALLSELLCDTDIATALIDAAGSIIKTNPQFASLLQLKTPITQQLPTLFQQDLGAQWAQISHQVNLQGTWRGQVTVTEQSQHSRTLHLTIKGHVTSNGDMNYLVCMITPLSEHVMGRTTADNVIHRSAILQHLADFEHYFNALPENSRRHSNLLLIEINPEGMLSHMSDIEKLAIRQQEVEVQLLLNIPSSYQLLHCQLGKLAIILPNTSTTAAHTFALSIMERLNHHGLGEGISIGITQYQSGQSMEAYLNNAGVALKRAKQNNSQNIGQAFTRTH